MKVFINEREYEYTSDYPVGWKFVSKDYFNFPVYFGTTPCFIKRFQLRPQNALVWELLGKLRFKNERNIPKIYDVVSVTENRVEVRYVFYEFVEGATLDQVLLRGESIDLERLVNDLFSAVSSVHKHNYWFTDLCEKNIFCDTKGKFRLIDVDSCLPLSEPANNDLDVNMFYYALVYKFYRDILQLTIKPADISGNSLNHLQILFLILNLKINAVSHTQDFYSDEIFDDLPPSLNSISPEFQDLFRRILDGKSDPNSTHDVQEVKQMIIENIIYPGSRKKKIDIPPAVLPEPLPPEPVPEIIPVITTFKASNNIVKKGQNFSLQWQLEDADKIVIKKNGKAFIQPKADESQIVLQESTVGNEAIKFSLVAFNKTNQVESDPVTVTVYDIGIVEGIGDNINTGKSLKLKWRTVLAAALVILGIVALFIFYQFDSSKASISGFSPEAISENHTLIINGHKFPTEPGQVKVFFNQVEGAIQNSSDTRIHVKVPQLGLPPGDGSVRVAVVVLKDTVFTGELLVTK